MSNRSITFVALICALCVGALWAFPAAWYKRTGPQKFVWLTERTNVADWAFAPMPIAKSEEAALTADVTFAGEFKREGDIVQVFAAKRFSNDPNEIGLFVHTPDRCWSEAGWKFEPITPDFVELDVHGVKTVAERRLFRWKSGDEMLVYFFGLSSGEGLPYRLDHNLALGQRQQRDAQARTDVAKARAVDRKLWGRVWDCFESRQQVVGPKQFFRVATILHGSRDAGGDERLKRVLDQWLQPGDFEQETAAFESSKRLAKKP